MIGRDPGASITAHDHGPQDYDALVIAGGRAPEVKAAGAEYADIPIDEAAVDGNLVTAPAWPAHPGWLAAFLKMLGTRIVHEETSAIAR